jgi:hypothetical protein
MDLTVTNVAVKSFVNTLGLQSATPDLDIDRMRPLAKLF